MRWTAQQLETYQTRRAACALSVPSRSNKRRDHSTQRWGAKEIDIHTAVVDHLRLRGRPNVHWHHPATGELRDPGTAAKLARMGTRAGLPDLLLLIDGRLHGLELKRDRGGRISPAQVAMHAELRSAGAIVETAAGLDHAMSILSSWGAFLPIQTTMRNAA